MENADRPGRRIEDECFAGRVRILNRAATRIDDDALRPHGVRVSPMNVLAAVAARGRPRPPRSAAAPDSTSPPRAGTSTGRRGGGGAGRPRGPVILTAATAMLAMIPLTRSISWVSMAVAIMGGLSVATFLTLIDVPSPYVLLFGVRPSVERPRSQAALPATNGRLAHALGTDMISPVPVDGTPAEAGLALHGGILA